MTARQRAARLRARTARARRAFAALPLVVRDLPLGLLFAGLALLPTLHDQVTQVGDMPRRPLDAVGYGLLLLQSLPLALRRRSPGLGLGLIAAGFALSSLTGYHSPAGSALLVALVSAGAHLERGRRATAAGLVVAYAAFAAALIALGSPERIDGFAFVLLMLGSAWAAGAWLRNRRRAEAERRREVAAATRTAERARIARDLHDVVTHHVTAMTVQAEAARYLTAAPERLDAALRAIGETGRLATADLRRLLDVLGPAGDSGAGRLDAGGRSEGARHPAGLDGGTSGRRIASGPEADVPALAEAVGPGADDGADHPAPLEDLRSLVARTRSAGQPVDLAETGGAPGRTAGEVAAHRVVQESLTNALKHARGAATAVTVDRGEDAITVEVRTAGGRGTTASREGSGRGLAGLRERVALLGGEFHAGPGEDGAFTVAARIPAPRAESPRETS
ncbi:sensor histidine kinase [Glycomyces terrestris]|uniref:sensor histidine kinase n=1 Tax=Glycomyces terrestris TaxID=2493553 RepID=UPI0018D5278F|nr:histidine kinase [Glycomyces terrestris]